MVPNLFKNWLLVSKITWGTWEIAEKQWKVQKVEIQWATFVQKIHPFRKNILCRGFMYLTFNYLFTKFPNSLCHFWNHKSFFRTQLLCIFLAQTLHTFDKSNPSNFRLATAGIKIFQIPHVIFGTKSQFFFKLCITL